MASFQRATITTKLLITDLDRASGAREMLTDADSSSINSSNNSSNTAGRTALWGLATTTAAASLALLPFLIVPWLPKRAFGALPYQQTPKHAILDALALLQASEAPALCQRPRSFIDLGSGE